MIHGIYLSPETYDALCRSVEKAPNKGIEPWMGIRVYRIKDATERQMQAATESIMTGHTCVYEDEHHGFFEVLIPQPDPLFGQIWCRPNHIPATKPGSDLNIA